MYHGSLNLFPFLRVYAVNSCYEKKIYGKRKSDGKTKKNKSSRIKKIAGRKERNGKSHTHIAYFLTKKKIQNIYSRTSNLTRIKMMLMMMRYGKKRKKEKKRISSHFITLRGILFHFSRHTLRE